MMLKAKENGINFDKILTLGHQKLYINEKEIINLSKRFNIDISGFDCQNNKYADEFFKLFLGSKTIESLDYSEYENCNIIHDMNRKIPQKYYQNYDVVIDGGALEHIFNFPVAIENCLNMVKQNGSIFIFSMANNHMGHGFYQFSPELYFRIFEKNGFETKNIILDEHKYPGPEISPTGKSYLVTDPKITKSRISVVSKKPLLIMVHAVRKEITELFSEYPIQSDYVNLYDDKSNINENKNMLKTFIKSILPTKIKNIIIGNLQLKKYSLKNGDFFRKW